MCGTWGDPLHTPAEVNGKDTELHQEEAGNVLEVGVVEGRR